MTLWRREEHGQGTWMGLHEVGIGEKYTRVVGVEQLFDLSHHRFLLSA